MCKGKCYPFSFWFNFDSRVTEMEYLNINAIVNECLCTVVDKKLLILLFCNLWYLNVGIIIVFRGMRRLAIFLTI